MAATEAKYHQPCLGKLYNKYRDFRRQKFIDEYQCEFAQGMYTLLFLLLGGRGILGSKSDRNVLLENFWTDPVLLSILTKPTFTNSSTQKTISRSQF